MWRYGQVHILYIVVDKTGKVHVIENVELWNEFTWMVNVFDFRMVKIMFSLVRK